MELITILDKNDNFPDSIFFTINNFSKDIILSIDNYQCDLISGILNNIIEITHKIVLYSDKYVDYLISYNDTEYFYISLEEINENNIIINVYKSTLDRDELYYCCNESECNEIINKLIETYLFYK